MKQETMFYADLHVHTHTQAHTHTYTLILLKLCIYLFWGGKGTCHSQRTTLESWFFSFQHMGQEF